MPRCGTLVAPGEGMSRIRLDLQPDVPPRVMTAPRVSLPDSLILRLEDGKGGAPVELRFSSRRELVDWGGRLSALLEGADHVVGGP